MATFYNILNAYYGQLRGFNRLKIRREAARTVMHTPADIQATALDLFHRRVGDALKRFPLYASKVREHLGSLPEYPQRLAPPDLPVWTREDQCRLMAQPDYPSQVPPHSFVHSTGGSTGQPMHFYVTRESYEWRRAVSDRGYSWAGAEEGRKSFYVWGTPVEQPPLLKQLRFGIHHLLERRTYFDSFHFDDERKKSCCDLINKNKPETLVGYAGNLVELARFVEQDPNVLQWRVRAIVTAAEGLHPGQRDLLEGTLGDEVFLSYGSREFMLVGMECEQHCGYHLSADNLYVEVVDEQGQPCKAGETGRILVTDLRNYATPFIRYQIGDLGIAAEPGRTCSCGLPLPLLRSVEGRIQENIVLPDSSKLTALFIPHMMKEFGWVKGYQIRQDAPGEITVKLIADEPLKSTKTERVKETLRGRTAPDMKIHFERVHKLAHSRSGKTPIMEPEGDRATAKDGCRTVDGIGSIPQSAHPSVAEKHGTIRRGARQGSEFPVGDRLEGGGPPPDDVGRGSRVAGRGTKNEEPSTTNHEPRTKYDEQNKLPEALTVRVAHVRTGDHFLEYRYGGEVSRVKCRGIVLPWRHKAVRQLNHWIIRDDIIVVHSHDLDAQQYTALATAKRAVGHVFSQHHARGGTVPKASRMRTTALGRVTDLFIAHNAETAKMLQSRYAISRNRVEIASDKSEVDAIYKRFAWKYARCGDSFKLVFGEQSMIKAPRLSWRPATLLTKLRYHGITARLVPEFLRKIAYRLLPPREADQGLWLASYQNVIRQAKPAPEHHTGTKLAIIKDLMLRHSYFEAACLEMGVPFVTVDISGNDWLQQVRATECDAWLARPFVLHSVGKKLYDDRLRVMAEDLGLNVFPSPKALWLYESKYRAEAWLEAEDIQHPETWIFNNRKEALDFARNAHCPLIFKTDLGSEGLGVSIVRSRHAAESLIRKCFGKGVIPRRRDKRDTQW